MPPVQRKDDYMQMLFRKSKSLPVLKYVPSVLKRSLEGNVKDVKHSSTIIRMVSKNMNNEHLLLILYCTSSSLINDILYYICFKTIMYRGIIV